MASSLTFRRSHQQGQEALDVTVPGEHITMGNLVAAYLRAGGNAMNVATQPERGPNRALLLSFVAVPGRCALQVFAEALQSVDDGIAAIERAV